MNISLESVLGGTRSLGDFQGKPLFLVAESLSHQGLNAELRSRLVAFVQANQALMTRMNLVSVALMPSMPEAQRGLARTGLKFYFKQSGLSDLLIDWDDSIYTSMGWPPAAKGWPVYALFDAQGRVLWGKFGAVSSSDIDALEALVRGILG